MTDGAGHGRREVLAGAGALATGLAGCAGLAVSNGGRPERVSLLAAGSLQHAMADGLRAAVDAPLAVEAAGSAAAARFVAEGRKDPDLLALADPALFDSVLETPWYVSFATNSLVLAYDPDSPGGRRVAAAGRDRWYDALLDDDVRLGRTDPDLDPLGYRALFALDLATDHYGTAADLRAAVPARDQVYPETQVLSALETGAVDAAVVYRSMAVDRDYAFVDLPPQVDLGSTRYADRYASTSYELPDGTTVTGDVVRYGATARRRSPTIDHTFETLVSGNYLAEYGFVVPDGYPRDHGAVPAGIAP